MILNIFCSFFDTEKAKEIFLEYEETKNLPMEKLKIDFEKYLINSIDNPEITKISDENLNFFISRFIHSETFNTIYPSRNSCKFDGFDATYDLFYASQTNENLENKLYKSFDAILIRDNPQISDICTTKEQILSQPPSSSKLTGTESNANDNDILDAIDIVLSNDYRSPPSIEITDDLFIGKHRNRSFDIKKYDFINEIEQKDLNKFIMDLIIKNYDIPTLDKYYQVYKFSKKICEEFSKNNQSNFRISEKKFTHLKKAFRNFNDFDQFRNNRRKILRNIKTYTLSVIIITNFFNQLLNYINSNDEEDSYLKLLKEYEHKKLKIAINDFLFVLENEKTFCNKMFF
ncbi:hypothetical protein GVAV_002246 [Gurleya vavrai]